jgi:O-antigen ligase
MENLSNNSIFNKITWQRSGFFFLCLALFLFPSPRSWTLWPIGIFLLFSLIGWINNFADIKSVKILFSKYKLILLPPVLYFLIHFIYFLTGDGTWTNVEERLLFILVPVVGLPLFVSDLLQKNIRYLLLAYISGLVIVSVFLITTAIINSLTFSEGSVSFNQFIEPGISRFTWQRLSVIENPTYLSLKILWAVSLLFFADGILNLKKTQTYFLITFFIIMLLLLSVRTELFLLIVIIILFIAIRFRQSQQRWIPFLLIPLLLISLFLVFRYNVRIVKHNKELVTRVLDERLEWRNKDPRARAWSSAIDLIIEKPLLGVGLGSLDSLVVEYKKHGYLTEADLKLNAHNQYLETQLAFGIPGTIVLFWMLLGPFFLRKRYILKDLVIPFMIIMTGSMLTVSVLVRVWGIMLFILFYCIITIPQEDQTADSEKESDLKG